MPETPIPDSDRPGKDVRRLPCGSAPEAIATATREIRFVNEHDVILARALATIERERAFAAFACSSAAHWAVLRGLERGRANELLNLGRLLLAVPETETDVRDGVMTPQSAAVVGRLIKPLPRCLPRTSRIHPRPRRRKRPMSSGRASTRSVPRRCRNTGSRAS